MAEPPDDFEVARLILQRERRRGTPFDRAWTIALEALAPPGPASDGGEAKRRHGCLAALGQTREWWQAAYEGTPAPPPPYGPAANAVRLRSMLQRLAA